MLSQREHFYLLTSSFEITHETLGQNLSQNIKTVFDLSLREKLSQDDKSNSL